MRVLVALQIGYVIASPILNTRDDDPQVASIVAAANIPKYTAPTIANRDITDWLAIGDSFAAGISADVPDDELNWSCSRFKQSYPSQMNANPRFPGHSTSRTFVFGACSGGKMQDVIDTQLASGTPDLSATNPNIGKPQIGTVSISGNDLGFGEIVNACLYHWTGYGDCTQLLKDAHAALDDPGRVFYFKVLDVFSKIMIKARTANPNFQLYVTGYIQFWNDDNTQCDTVSWAPWYKAAAPLTTTLRKDMNSLVDKLNDLLEQAAEALNRYEDGVYYVDGFQDKFNGHRFCEQEDDPNYHKSPIDDRTWFIHYDSPYENPSSATGFSTGSFFDQVNSILIPPKDGKSTTDQIKGVDGDLSKLNPAYNDYDSMTAALNKMAKDDPSQYSVLPITWIRVMHPKGSGYGPMSDAVIDNVIKYGAAGAASTPATGRTCAGTDGNKFMGRDDMNDKIGKFCADAAAQKVQDKDSGSTRRDYNGGTRYDVTLSMDWPSGQDITSNMEANCNQYMKSIMDDCNGNDPKNPLDWKYGGYYQVDQVRYNIIPTQDQGYAPGTCSFHLQEDEQWSGVDGPGTERHWSYEIEQALMKDGAGNEIGRLGFKMNSGDGDPQSEGDGHPSQWQTKLPDNLVITSEAQGNPKDYVQFTIGGQTWSTNDPDSGTPRCNVGGWNKEYSPANRNMDCFFNC